MRFMMFTKHLQELSLVEAGKAIKRLGFEGADLTVRPGGFVDPTKIKSALPEAIGVLHDCGLEVPLLTTSITSADDPVAAPTFELAAQCNVPNIKLGYWKYGEFGSYKRSLQSMSHDLDGIETLAQRTGVRANLHVHSDAHMTAMAWAIWYLIKDRNPKAFGAYADPGHMTAEGAGEGWRMGLDLLGDRISVVAVKDLAWEQQPDEKRGKAKWGTKMVPLNRGMVDWKGVVACLRALNYREWISFHSEYQGWHSWRELGTDEVIRQTGEDLGYFKSLM